MGKRAKVALAVLAVALAGVIVRQLAEPNGPVYQGKPLSEWLKAYAIMAPLHDGAEEAQLKADEAVRQIGTNALPTLLQMLRAKDSALKTNLISWAEKQHLIKIEYTRADDLNYRAQGAFGVLGAKAQSAVPQLIDIANRNISSFSRSYTIGALAYVGPPAKEAVPSLLGWATNEDVAVRLAAIIALGEIHADPDRVVPCLTNALHDRIVQLNAVDALDRFGPDIKLAVSALVEAVPILLRWTTNSNPTVRVRAIRSLSKISAEPDPVLPLLLPVLIKALHDQDSNVQKCAVDALGSSGSYAKIAAPALVELLNTPEAQVRACVTNALRKIDPEAAAKAGVK